LPSRMRRWLGLCSVIVLGACSQMPVAPGGVEDVPGAGKRAAGDFESSRESAIAIHRKLALQYKAAGDLAAAETQWQILTVLAPDDAAFRRELDAARAAIRRGVTENLQAGAALHRAGDNERAAQAMLRVLALDPENAEAAKALRDIDRQKMARTQGERASKFRLEDLASPYRAAPAATAPPPESSDGYDLEQRLEMFKAGDVAGGIRELRAYVDANPKDRAARQRIGATVYERGTELEAKGNRESALALYEQAVALRGDALPQWTARMQALRKALSVEYFEKGTRAFRSDMALAIRQWETSLRYDPHNLKASERLREARLAQEKLQRIESEAPRK
jgi:tetratricopeptide (TPR) repeat protein